MLRFTVEKDQAVRLPIETRRALALLKAAAEARDADAARALIALAEGPAVQSESEVDVSLNACNRLADALRHAGYPLTDDGIKRFKMERGYSNAVRISPAIASEYGRHARGCSTVLDVTPTQARRFDLESRRALRILLMIGREPLTLTALCHKLGVPESRPVGENIVVVNRAAARALVDWAHHLGLDFTNSGMRRFTYAAKTRPDVIDAKLARFIAEAVVARGEPDHEYARRTFDGHTLNQRTYAMLMQAQEVLGEDTPIQVLKGSYLPVARGAHPHKGGGVLDISVKKPTPAKLVKAVSALRRVGFAAWFRPRKDRGHIHTVAIGDRDLSPAALGQVKSYFEQRDGRSRSAPDPHRDLVAKRPKWAEIYGLRYANID